MSRSALLLALCVMAPGTARAQPVCTLSGRPDHLAIVVPALEEAIVVTGHPSVVVLDPSHAHAVGRVRSPIAFEGSVDPLELVLHARPGRSLAEGTLSLGAESSVRLLPDGSVVATLAPGTTATLPSLPCGALTLTPTARSTAERSSPGALITHTVAAASSFALHASAESTEAAATLRSEETLDVRVVATRGSRARVIIDFESARIRGWVDASVLTAIEPREPNLWGSLGSLGSGACGRSDHPYAYEGPARVRAGAVIRSPSGLAWARVTRSLSVERVGVRAWEPADVELLRVAGFESRTCGLELLFDLAVVRADEVVMPSVPPTAAAP